MPPLDVKSSYLIRTTSGVSVLCRRGMGDPKIMSGGARYTVIERPRRKSTVQWAGDDPYRMDVPIMLDGWADEISVEADCAKITQMRQSKGDLVPPVEIYVDGALPVKGAKWVVEDYTWGDNVIWQVRKGIGFRLRQDITLHLLQSVPITVLQGNRPPSATTPYIVKVGDTMASIAKQWNVTVPAIKKANNIRDPKKITQMTNQTILIPPAVGGLG